MGSNPLIHSLGHQILAELHDCNKDYLDEIEKCREIMVGAAQAAHAEIRETVFHKFEPQGVSGVVVISESHLTIHTWPELGYAAVDVFTCGETVDPWDAIEHIVLEFDAEYVTVLDINRGMKDLNKLVKGKGRIKSIEQF